MPYHRTQVGLSAFAILFIGGCTISSGPSKRAPNSQPPPPYVNQPPGSYGYQQPPAPYAQNPAPNAYPQPAPPSYAPPAQPSPQYSPPGAAMGLCSALQYRERACPSEGSSAAGCEHDERCLTGVSRPEAMSMLSNCIQRSLCNVSRNIVDYCVGLSRQQLQPTLHTQQLAMACSAAVAVCPDKVADKCASAHLLNNAVAQQVLQCLAIPDCRAKDRCVEGAYEARGCP